MLRVIIKIISGSGVANLRGAATPNGSSAGRRRSGLTMALLGLAAALFCATQLWGEARAQGEGDLRRAVALLDYVAGDYPRAIGPHGEVLSPSEFEEQLGFVQDAARDVRNGAGAAGEPIAVRLDALARSVEGKALPSEVTPVARALRDEIAQQFRVAILPAAPPDLAHGRALYAQSCAACHGALGHPPPPEILQLSTKPVAFADPAEVAQLSAQRAFAGSTYGVPKTAMPAFEDAYDDAARWDLAYYVLSLAHPARDRTRGLRLARAALVGTGYRELAAQTDEQLLAQLSQAGLKGADLEEALSALRAGPFEPERASSQGLAQVRRDLQTALGFAQRGDREGARRTVISAYLDHFEPFEPALRAHDPQLVQDIEAGFLALRQAVDARGDGRAGAPPPPRVGAAVSSPGPASAADAVARLDALLEKADTAPPGGGLVAFFAALAIALREGVEAALLVALLLSLLRKSDRAADSRSVHLGWSAALLAGGATWLASGALLHLPGASRELTEGLLQLLTAALLLYASHWVLAAGAAKKVVGFISSRTLAGGGAIVVFWLSFGAVYREMFEMVIFFRGLLFETPGGGRYVLFGALAGLGALALLVFAFQGLGKKLKPRPLLLTCGILLCGLAVLMVGKGVHALQLVGVLPITVWGAFQVPSLGVYPTREGILAQAAVLALLAGSAAWTLLRGDQGSSPGPADGGRAAKTSPAAARV
jgi:high-affinity iron transporter